MRIRRHRSRVLATLLLIAAGPCYAQPGAPGAAAGGERAAVEAGERVAALDKCIFAVFQAKDGTYWFGSDGQGVYHVDGKTILRYTTKHGLRGDHIRSIQQDGAGNILVSGDGGVSRFDGSAFQPLVPVNGDPYKGEWKLQDGDLWFTGWQDEGIVYRYDGAALHRLAFPRTKDGEEHIAKYPRAKFPRMAYSPYDTYTIFKDSKGHLWFGTSTLGACRYDGKTFAWVSRAELDFGDEDGFGVRSIIEDKDGKFWLSRTLHRFVVSPAGAGETGNVALSYRKEAGLGDGDDAGKRGYSHVMSGVKDAMTNMWLATLRAGVWRYDGKSLTHYPVLAEGKPIMVFAIFKDRYDNLWLGTHEHGVYKFNGTAFEPVKF